jgi:hypothetical protein
VVVELARALADAESSPPEEQIKHLSRLMASEAYQRAWAEYRAGSPAWERHDVSLGQLEPLFRTVAEAGPVAIYSVDENFFPLSVWLREPMKSSIDEVEPHRGRLASAGEDLDRMAAAAKIKSRSSRQTSPSRRVRFWRTGSSGARPRGLSHRACRRPRALFDAYERASRSREGPHPAAGAFRTSRGVGCLSIGRRKHPWTRIALERTLLLLCADLAIIIGASRVFGWLFGKVGQPPVVGEILAGVILGPSLVGRLYPGAIQTMLTPQTSAVLSAMAQVGLVLLMLLIGLEFPFDRLWHAARASTAVAVAGIVVPFASRLRAGGLALPSRAARIIELAYRLFSRPRSRSPRFRSWADPHTHAPDADAPGADLDHGRGDRRRAGVDPARRGRLDGDAREGRSAVAGDLARRRHRVGDRLLGDRTLRPRAPARAADRSRGPLGRDARRRSRRGLRRGDRD